MTKEYKFVEKLWIYPGKSAWHFITLPVHLAKEIKYTFGHAVRGWGSLPADVQIGKTTWRTSIFPDKQSNSYLLPVKAAVRKSEALLDNTSIKVSIVLKD